MPSSKGSGLNCFALLSRANELLFETTCKLLDEHPSACEVEREERRIEKALAQKRRERERVVTLVRKGMLTDDNIATELQTIQREEDQLGRTLSYFAPRTP